VVEIGLQAYKHKDLYEEILAMQKSNIEHATAVSTMVVIFALINGYVDETELAELSLGALLHDVGQGLLPPQIFDKPMIRLSPADNKMYQQHPIEGAQLLEQFGDNLSDLVKRIVLQHHERYDGLGFPKRLRNLEIDERVQLITLADRLSDLIDGRYDGKKWNPSDAFEFIKQRSDNRSEQLVSDEIFIAIYQSFKQSQGVAA
jgi:HD-GYP domain-containing protein (c-di-GMP phosphodiesterase class II)